MTVRSIGRSLRDLKSDLRKLPVSVAHDLAKQAAPLLTRLAMASFDGGRNVYGDPRPKSTTGADLTLVETGKTRRTLRFVANGTIIRCELGPRYARYLIGKYKILPVGDRTSMPVSWIRAMRELGETVVTNRARVAA